MQTDLTKVVLLDDTETLPSASLEAIHRECVHEHNIFQESAESKLTSIVQEKKLNNLDLVVLE